MWGLSTTTPPRGPLPHHPCLPSILATFMNQRRDGAFSSDRVAMRRAAGTDRQGVRLEDRQGLRLDDWGRIDEA